MAREYIPFQEGDKTLDEQGRLIIYSGPIYHVTYPSTCDHTREIKAWEKLGYIAQQAYSYSKQEFTLKVLGEIPEWAQDRMKERQMRCQLTKQRGHTIKIE